MVAAKYSASNLPSRFQWPRRRRQKYGKALKIIISGLYFCFGEVFDAAAQRGHREDRPDTAADGRRGGRATRRTGDAADGRKGGDRSEERRAREGRVSACKTRW